MKHQLRFVKKSKKQKKKKVSELNLPKNSVLPIAEGPKDKEKTKRLLRSEKKSNKEKRSFGTKLAQKCRVKPKPKDLT